MAASANKPFSCSDWGADVGAYHRAHGDADGSADRRADRGADGSAYRCADIVSYVGADALANVASERRPNRSPHRPADG